MAGLAGLAFSQDGRTSTTSERKTLLRQLSKVVAVTAAAVGLALGIAASAAPAHAALAPSSRCAVAKRKAAVKRLRAIDACFAKPPQPPDPECLAKADGKFQREFLSIEARGGCVPETGDAPGVGHLVDQCEAALVQVLPGTCLAAGSECGGLGAFCCTGLVCSGRLGELPHCN